MARYEKINSCMPYTKETMLITKKPNQNKKQTNKQQQQQQKKPSAVKCKLYGKAEVQLRASSAGAAQRKPGQRKPGLG
jgi:CRISPR/Cas system CSM-associated protein Csm4 (group 5 of RAMP superfamily)